MKLDLENKTVIVTGATNGIGRAIAEAFHVEKANVIGIDLKAPEDKPAFEIIEASVTDYPAIRKIFKKIHDERGSIDVLVNNAGISANNFAHLIKDEEISRAIEINFRSLFELSREYFLLNKKQGGCIINIASVLALIGSPLGSIYGATKGAVVAATRSLSVEWARNNFRVNAVCPGLVETDMTKQVRSNANMFQANLQNIPMKRFAKPGEIADACVFLGSAAASYITGQTLVVDGGMTVKR